MKKILGLTVAALLIMALVGGGTWAYFSDPETSANNTLTAGTLDLNINGGNTAVTTFSVSSAGPGDSGSGSSVLANVGSYDGELDIEFSAITNTGGAGGTEYEDGSGDLGGIATIAAYLDIDQSGGWSGGDIGLSSNSTGVSYNHPAALEYATVNSYGSDSWDAVVATMASSASDNFTILWQVPTSANNTIQGDSVSFDVTFTLEQAAAD